jgi:DNA-directed RNA polymerase alpha subunit
MRDLRICEKGHRYYKSSDCPVCPVCEDLKKPDSDFLAAVSAPARRALENAGIKTVAQLSDYSESRLLKLHGMGPSSIPKLRKVLKGQGLDFKKESVLSNRGRIRNQQ